MDVDTSMMLYLSLACCHFYLDIEFHITSQYALTQYIIMQICLFKENILLLNISFLISGCGSVASFEHHNQIQYKYTRVHAHTYMYTTHTCKRMCTCTHIHTHAYIHTYIRAYGIYPSPFNDLCSPITST